MKLANNKLKVHCSLILAQGLFAGFEVLSHVALNDGVGAAAFTFYRNFLAMLFLGTIGMLMEHRQWVHLSFRRAAYIFFLGFIGVTLNQMCYLLGLGLTSVVFASTIRNTIPIFTFVLAFAFKLENVNLRFFHGRAKLAGAVFGLAGSLILSFYGGPMLIPSNFSKTRPWQQQSSTYNFRFFNRRVHHLSFISPRNLGTIFLVLSSASFSLLLVLQAPVLDFYRAPVSFASICCLSSVIQLPLLATIFETNWDQWKINYMKRGEALCIAYAGLIGSGIVSGIQSWAVHNDRGGPVVVAAYQPLETLITACLSFFLLHESLHLGTLIGGIIVVLGLYLLAWGKGLELKASSVIADEKLTLSNGESIERTDTT